MLVSEAKQKICPFIFNTTSTALGETQGYHINCICSDCMAWIKQDNKNVHLFTLEELNSNEECGYCQRLNK